MRACAVAGALALLAGCSDDSTVEPADAPSVEITVAAGSPLEPALRACAADFTPARVELRAGTTAELAGELRRGRPADVFAADDVATPAALHRAGVLERPSAFIGDELVLAVAKDGDVGGLEDLERPGVIVAVVGGAATAGALGRTALRRLGVGGGRPDAGAPGAAAVLRAVQEGSADAGLVFRSSFEAAGDGLEAIELPESIRPAVAYAAGVVSDTREAGAAQAFLDDLREGNCHDALLTAGFGEAPA